MKIAAHHVNKRGGVLIGDVVGLGKTLMATALARSCSTTRAMQTLIICPKNLVTMWQEYVDQLRAYRPGHVARRRWRRNCPNCAATASC